MPVEEIVFIVEELVKHGPEVCTEVAALLSGGVTPEKIQALKTKLQAEDFGKIAPDSEKQIEAAAAAAAVPAVATAAPAVHPDDEYAANQPKV